MKFQVGDRVKVTGGKDKGKEGLIIKVNPEAQTVTVKGVNLYTRHIKKTTNQEGQKVKRERALPTANVAIINNEGMIDRVGYVLRDGRKFRVFKKTGQTVPQPTKEEAK